MNPRGMSMQKRRCRDGRGEKIINSISRNLDLPADTVSGYAHIEISGNRELILEGCKGVLEYTDCIIAMNTGKLTVKLCGCDMTIVSMQGSQAVIRGIITSVEFCN